MKKMARVKNTTKLALDSEIMIRRLLAVSSNRDVNLQSILEHEVSAVPFAIFHDDRSMRKSVKYDLAKKLEI